MKTKNIFKTLAFAMLMPAMLLTTACSNEDEFVNNDSNNQKGYPLQVTVNVTRQGDEGTTRATYNESTKKLSFSSGDKLFVQGTEATAGQFAGELTWQSGGTFRGTIYTKNAYTGTANALLTSAGSGAGATLLPNGYESVGFLFIAANNPEAKYDDQVSCDYDMAFALTKAAGVEQLSYEQAGYYDNGFTLRPSNPILNFTITGLSANTEVAIVFSYNAAYVNVNKNVTTNSSGTATFAIGVACSELNDCSLTVGGNAITLGSHVLTAGKIYNIARNAIPGALSGQFSVSSTKKVYFSKGNLQAVCSSADGDGSTQETWTWQFATNQFDFIGGKDNNGNGAETGNNYINGNGSVSAAGTVDLFGWSTGNTYFGINNIIDDFTYSGDFVDWGTLAITNGGNTANYGWRTLTGGNSGEWAYLFKTRAASTVSGVENARFAKAYLFGTTHGIILFPDVYTHPAGVDDPTGINATDATSWNANTYSAADWAKMEAAGCVFLPAANNREGATWKNTSVACHYWTSTLFSDANAYPVVVGNSSCSFGTSPYTRKQGRAVRLVIDAN